VGTEKARKPVPRAVACFRLPLPDGTAVEVDGAALVGAPERRLTSRR